MVSRKAVRARQRKTFGRAPVMANTNKAKKQQASRAKPKRKGY